MKTFPLHFSPAPLLSALCGLALFVLVVVSADLSAAADDGAKPAQKRNPPTKSEELTFPPALPGGKTVVSDTSEQLLKPLGALREGVAVAKTAPTIDFTYYPGQTYPGNPWSNWGDSLAVGGKYYSAIGDHRAANSRDLTHGSGTARVYEYDPAAQSFRLLTDVAQALALPTGHYVPGKIHSRIDQGSDGWLYFATHRGSTTVTTEQYHYQGDWVLRCDPASGKTEVVVHGPVPKHCIPCSVLDRQRMIFYGATAPGTGKDGETGSFFAYDIAAKKLLFAGPDGPSRAMILAQSTGRVYYVSGAKEGPLLRYDPKENKPPQRIADGPVGLRAASSETQQGIVYAVSSGQAAADAEIWSLNTRTEKIERLGPAAVASQAYVASLDVDPTGRYLYYIPGAHGSSDRDGSPVVQFDVKTRQKKIIAFLHPFFQERYGCSLRGTYGAALDPAGDKLYITWNISRGSKAWDCCGLTVIHIPESERRP